jgi:O-acetylhomoserine (thiol)-lyase
MSLVVPQTFGFATRQIHAGVEPVDGHGARATPVYLTAGFVFDDFQQAHERFAGTDDGYSYTRVGNPTNAAVERRVAALEGGVGALLLGSGQAAVATALLALVGAGDHVLAAADIYEGTRELLKDNLARLGVTVDFIARSNDPAAWDAAVRPETRAFFAESISNPKNDVLDIAAVARTAHRHGIPLVVDNTLATPYLLRPTEHGADVVVHSASKFLAGHGTVLGGIVVDGGGFAWDADPARFPHLARDRRSDGRTYVERFGSRAFVEYARSVVAMRLGPVPSPFNAFLIQQGIETLSLRLQRHCDSALEIARWLEAQPDVASVDYSGLASSPYHAVAKHYLPRGQGSVFSFTLRGGAEAAEVFHDSLRLFTRMTHLGDVRSLVLHPASTTHVLRTPAELEAAGIGPGLLRLSVGLEDPEDLVRDIAQALAAVRSTTLVHEGVA